MHLYSSPEAIYGNVFRPDCLDRCLVSSLIVSLLLHLIGFHLLGMVDHAPGGVDSIPIQVRLVSPNADLVETAPVASDPAPALPLQKKSAGDITKPIAAQSLRDVPPMTDTAVPQKLDRVTDRNGAKHLSPMPEPTYSPSREAAGSRVRLRQVDLNIRMYLGEDRRDGGLLAHQYRTLNGELYGVRVMPFHVGGDADTPAEWKLQSSGSIRRHGLSPVMVDALGSSGLNMLMFGKVDSSQGGGGKYSARIQDGVLDRHSLLYQFMIQPPNPGGGEIWITDGSSYQPYRYRREGEGRFPLEGVGVVTAARFVFDPTAGGSPFELWLIPEMHHLPVKMRYQNAEGESVELVVVKMSYD